MKRNNSYLPDYDIIVNATKGDVIAMQEVLRSYERYITKLSMENGHVVEELRNRLRGKLLSAILKFNTEDCVK